MDKSDKKISAPFISSYNSIANSIKKNTDVIISSAKITKKTPSNSNQNTNNTQPNNPSLSNNKKKFGMKK